MQLQTEFAALSASQAVRLAGLIRQFRRQTDRDRAMLRTVARAASSRSAEADQFRALIRQIVCEELHHGEAA